MSGLSILLHTELYVLLHDDKFIVIDLLTVLIVIDFS